MPRSNRLGFAWYVSGVVALGCWFAARYVGLGVAVVPGIIFLAWGLAIGTNWRSAAEVFPRTGLGHGRAPIFQLAHSTGLIRLIFSGIAVAGAVFLAVGIAHLG